MFLGIFVAVSLALIVHGAIRDNRSTMMTVNVEKGEGVFGHKINFTIPMLTYFNGGIGNQLFLFTSTTGSYDWNFDSVPDSRISLVGDRETQRFLLVCAPKYLSGDQALQYMYSRYHPQNWHVTWTGWDVPGWVYIYC